VDDIDRASEREQLDRDSAIAAAARMLPSLPENGQCYYCLASVAPGARFCDSDCRDDYDALKKAEARRG